MRRFKVDLFFGYCTSHFLIFFVYASLFWGFLVVLEKDWYKLTLHNGMLKIELNGELVTYQFRGAFFWCGLELRFR
jgi:hypothetical protein